MFECGINLGHPFWRDRAEILADPVLDRDGSNLATERNGVLPKRTLLGWNEYFEGIELLVKRGSERNNDRCGCVCVSDIVLHDETRTCSPLFGSLCGVEFNDYDVASTDRRCHPLPLWGIAEMVISFRRDAREFLSEVAGPLGTLTVPLGQLLTSGGLIDNDLPSLFANHDVVSPLDSEAFPEIFRDRHLSSFSDFSPFALAHAYSYPIHTHNAWGGRQ